MFHYLCSKIKWTKNKLILLKNIRQGGKIEARNFTTTKRECLSHRSTDDKAGSFDSSVLRFVVVL